MIASLYAMLSIDGQRAIDAPIRVFRDDLAAVEAQAAEIVDRELRAAGGSCVGPELLYRLENAALLHLLAGARLLRRVEDIETADAYVEDRSSGTLRRLTPLRRWYARVRTLAFGGMARRRHTLVRCRCICGVRFTARSENVRSGATRSCGCLRDDVSAGRAGVGAPERRVA